MRGFSFSWFIVGLLMLLASFHPQPATSRPRNYFTDLESLLAFKADVIDPTGLLTANWTTNTSFCSWAGVHCSRRRQRVTAIRLVNSALHGTISPHLANLSLLSELHLSNNFLSGPIPEDLARLPRLTMLVLERNLLSGPIPSTIFNSSLLTELYVGGNNLTGTLPSNNSFTLLPRIRYISLSRNRYTGRIGSGFSHCRHLQALSLSTNQFTGTIPTELGSLPELTLLTLAGNQLHGAIPASLGNLTKLNTLDLSWNGLITGFIPKEIGKLRKLTHLSLGNCSLTGNIPAPLLNCSLLHFIFLGVNSLTGTVADNIGKSLPLMKLFDVSENQLNGTLDFLSSLSNCRYLRFLQIGENRFEGPLPGSVGNFSSNLQNFFADEMNLIGSIPAALGNLSGLIMLSLERNRLTGPIPLEILRMRSVQLISLESNQLSGHILLDIGLLTHLNILNLKDNKFFGAIPDSIANISGIQKLYLGGNTLSSSIPESLWTLGSLLHLDLSANSLEGSLPPEVSNLKALLSLNLSSNRLSGNISSALGQLQTLQVLNLSNNIFSGRIPESFGGLISATDMDLSHNLLTGAIPDSIANLSFLVNLDLSFNRLQGRVPRGGVLSDPNISSLIGNDALCGAPLLNLPPCTAMVSTNDSTRKAQLIKYILPPLLVVFMIISCLCLVYVFYLRRGVRNGPDKAVALHGDHIIVSRHELIHATDNFSEANLLGRGGCGSVFKGCLNNGLNIAVKVIDLETEEASRSFDVECEVLRTVRHRNLIKIISVCSNLDFRALILPLMPNGSLEQWLYSNNSSLTMLQRLNIMLDVSSALEYLHHQLPQVVLHRDLKPTNVLLDYELVAHVSDFGIAKILHDDSGSISTATMAGTIGYMAPEYNFTRKLSRMSDVYSFGILLLETFTGRKPTDAMFSDQLSFRDWICKAHPSTIMNIADDDLLNDQNLNKEPSDQGLMRLHECVVSVIELGLLCSSYSPKERIPMTQVAIRLQKIKTGYPSS